MLEVLGAGNVAVSNPGQLVDADITLLDLIDASIDAAEADNNTAAVSALNALRIPVGELQGTINLADLITLGLPDGALADIELNALDLIGGAIQLYNYENVVTTTEPVALDNAILRQFGIGGAELLLQVVEPPHFECGGAGTKFHTSTVRAKLSVDLADTSLDTSGLDGILGPLVGGLVATDITLGNLDIYFEFGRVDGEVVSADPETKTASVILAPSAIDLFLGSIDDSIFFNRDRAILPSDVDYGEVGRLEVATLGGLIRESAGISVKSFAQSAPGTSETIFFSPPYPRRQAIGDGASSFSDLIGTLARNLDIQIEESIGTPVGPLIDTVVEPVVGDLVGGVLVDAITPVIDLTIDPLLGFFGVGIGEAEASISGVTSICVERSDCPVSGPSPDGNATAAYGSPTHLIYDTLFMGLTPPDEDTASRANADATGDDLSGRDDEDGVTLPPLTIGQMSEIKITLVEAGTESGFLQGWIDWNGDGQFTEDERIARDITLSGGGNLTLSITVPSGARAGQSFARFRWSTVAGLDPDGAAPDGEVEDHSVSIAVAPAPQARGRVINDNGTDGGTPHDATLNGGETGLAGVTMQLETPEGQILAVDQTAETGAWAATLPEDYTGTVIARVVPPTGMMAISESPSTASADNAPTDGRIAFSASESQQMSAMTFGVIEEPRLYQDGQVFVEAGQIATLFHDYVAGSTGEVSFAVTGVSGDLAAVSVYRDPNCDGTLTTPLNDPLPVTNGDRICLAARVATSSGMSPGDRITYEITALTEFAGGAGFHEARNADVVSVARANGGIRLEKTVENLTQDTGETRANLGAPGDVLLYRLKLQHTGLAAVSDLEVRDMTPAHTTLEEVVSETVALGNGTECALTLPETPFAG